MNALMQAFYDVMYKYMKCFSEQGVRANLNAWRENKGNLVELLRRHPGWNEEELAIVFSLSEGREIDRDVVDECKFTLSELVSECGLSQEQTAAFNAAFAAATAEYSKFPSENNIGVIQAAGGIKCAPGQKTSRIIGRLCSHFGIDRHAQYNSVFARLADAFNPLQVHKTGILSVHPCDFLEMSNKDNSWSSCHGLDNGGYQAGCLSYLADGVSMIFFTVDDGIKEGFHRHPKRTRQIFCYADHVLLQSRLYPDENNEQVEQYRGLVQKAISACLGVPNLWTMKAKKDDQKQHYTTVEGSRQYHDYDYYCRICLLKDTASYGTLRIGHPSLCVCCGQPYRGGYLKCNCDNLVVCADCGKTVPADNARYVEGAYFCNACQHICACCGEVVRTDMYPAFNRQGRLVEICEGCYQTMTAACAACSVQPVCSLISGARFCNRTAVTAAVA